MILFPLPGFAVSYLFGVPESRTFFVEAAGILTFGLYWAVKSRELALSRLEKHPVEVIQGKGSAAPLVTAPANPQTTPSGLG
jgi:hypothetical protein